jgi:hypothetical protein
MKATKTEYAANRYAAGPERKLLAQLFEIMEEQQEDGCQMTSTDLVAWCLRREILSRGVKPVTD